MRRPFSPNRHVLDVVLHHYRQQSGATPPPRSAFQPVPVAEQARVYHYPDGSRLPVRGVEKISAEPFEHTWLETTFGESFMIPPGWTHCDVMSEDEYELHHWIL